MGLSLSMFMVGLSYVQGTGVQPDLEEGRKWLRMAADSGIEEAKEVLSQL
jgi:TPR repeat protein